MNVLYIIIIRAVGGRGPPLIFVCETFVQSCHFSWEGKCPGGFMSVHFDCVGAVFKGSPT